MKPLNVVPIEVLTAQKKAAQRLRSEFLFGVHDGLFTVPEVITAAVSAENRPLLKVRLFQLLLAAPGVSEPKARRIAEGTLRLAASKATPTRKGLNTTYKKMTLAWLLDTRSNGRRLACLTEMMVAEGAGIIERTAPWPGFPMSPAPSEATHGITMASYAGIGTKDLEAGPL